MVKGGDWAYGCQLVEEAFAALPGPGAPPRNLTPMVLTDTGAKLSKSLIREGTVSPPPGARPWLGPLCDPRQQKPCAACHDRRD
ncbi:hypothetical protein [Streptomyces purpurascens]|uniref:Uncharacterized protein n=1 Tax=Streptomyces purpurascens TaxID=1924 RepID=A0ABZ1MY91_STREF|nr:hypothetical protein [Streptomyces purpurascens]MCE7052251.1 hypothetical protein [Streptomyces purpurascens]GHA55887.1 hypothetical protein GCM10010303_79690 [Streptomyces purpurascens]